MFNYKEEYEKLQKKSEEESAKYNTRLTRKACLVVGIVCFVAGFLAKALVF